jgi:peptide/nickel transport system permease protein
MGPVGRFLVQWPVLPAAVLGLLVFTGVSAPWLAPKDPIVASIGDRHIPPAWFAEGTSRHLLGTDHAGRDLLSRIIHGARISLMVAVVSLSSGFVVGTTIGMVSGYAGGIVDEVIIRIVDIWSSLPFLMIALVLVLVFGQSLVLVLALLALLAWASFVRVVRAQTLSLKVLDYVALARVAGASPFRILFRHILPGVINSAVVIASLNVGTLILSEATLSFLGAGIPAPTPSWGILVAEGRDYLGTAWWSAFFPGMAIFLVVMSLNFLGDWMRDRLDPRLRQL